VLPYSWPRQGIATAFSCEGGEADVFIASGRDLQLARIGIRTLLTCPLDAAAGKIDGMLPSTLISGTTCRVSRYHIYSRNPAFNNESG
jgi:hypothetical protein